MLLLEITSIFMAILYFYTRTDYFYSEISDFTILDGKIHYNDSVEPLLDNALLKNLDYLSNTYFENSDDKEYFVKVEY